MKNLILILILFPLFSIAQISEEDQIKIDSIQEVIQKSNSDTSKVNGWLAMAKIYRKSDPDKNKELNQKVIDFSKEKASVTSGKVKEFFLKSEASALSSFGDLNRGKGDYPKALEFYDAALKIHQELNDPKLIAGTYNNIGIVYGIQADYKECEKYMLKSLGIYEENDDKDGIANSYNNLGNIHYYQGDYKPAIEYWTKSLKYKEAVGEKLGMANTLNNIGNIYRDLKDYEKSIEYYSRSMEIYKEIEDQSGVGVCSYNMGNIYLEMGEMGKALKLLSQSLTIHQETGNKRGIADALNGIGGIYKERNDLKNAEENYQNALKIHEEIGGQKGISVSLNSLADIYLQKGNLSKALDFGERSLKIGQEIGSLLRIKEASNTLWKINKKLGNTTAALEMHELYTSSKDSLISEENRMEIIRQEYDYQYNKQFTADSIASAERNRLKDMELAAQKAEKEKLELENKQQEQQKYFLFGGLALALILGGIIYSRFRISNKQKSIIEDQKFQVDEAFVELETKNKEILDSINYAKRIQYAILPPQQRVKDYLPNSFIFYRPKDIVAGDFYWLEVGKGPNKEEKEILFAACDCTGHGVPGAMVSVVCNNGLNRAVREHGLTNPGEILDKTREIVIAEFAKSEQSKDGFSESIDDGMDVALASIEKRGKGNLTLKYAGAHNPLWIIRKNPVDKDSLLADSSFVTSQRTHIMVDKEYTLIEIKADKQPIGKFHKKEPYTCHQLNLLPGDTVYLFTDGYVDQFGGGQDKPGGKKFKTTHFKKFLLSIQDKDMEQQGEQIEETFERWKGVFEQVDDVCVIGVRV
ncbi:MAG: tetratricopeptide repeat protein [Crocinitomicaceae bacterium]|nr:tetratricopeptide repeat protein [Crocinitomicaceae bacterium]